MNNLLTFDTAQLGYYFLILLSSFVTLMIVGRNLKSLVPHSFEFNRRYFGLGLSIALLTSIVLINWQTTDRKERYVVEEISSEPEIFVMPRLRWPQPEVKPPPPPEPKLKIPKKLPQVFRLKVVDDPAQVTTAATPEPAEVDLPAPVIDKAPPPMPEPILVPDPDETPLLMADQMPRFPGCEDMEGDTKEKEKCATENLLRYIYAELAYPVSAKQNRIQGTAVLRFVVEKDGSIGEIEIMRDPGMGCGAAVQKVIESMNNMPEGWTPGKQRGRPVRVIFTLPVKFHLN